MILQALIACRLSREHFRVLRFKWSMELVFDLYVIFVTPPAREDPLFADAKGDYRLLSRTAGASAGSRYHRGKNLEEKYGKKKTDMLY